MIVAHGDLDGIVSATLVAEQLDISVEELKVVFTQPFLLDKIDISDDIEKVYVVDIAINNRDPQMTEQFIEQLGDRLVRWIDHHQGWSKADDKRFIIYPTAPACATILGSGMPPRIAHLYQFVFDAVAADTREGELSEVGQLIEKACKADLRNDNVRVAAVKWLLGDEQQKPLLEETAQKYAAIQEETEWLATAYVHDGNVAVVDVPKEYFRTYGAVAPEGHDFDLTQLLLAGQRLATFAVAKVIDSRSGEEMVTIATKSGVNLVELFELPSGAPFRVTLPVERLEEAVEKIHSLDPNLRHCQCGSGESWVTCQAGSSYCG